MADDSAAGASHELIQLSEVEARVLGSLMEKQRTTPANYPLTLNSLVLACNQKSSREPVMNLYEGDVGHVVNKLRDRNLIKVAGLSRVERYHQKLAERLGLDNQAHAVLCVLMLRGPQTLNEIRTNTARLAEFEDADDLQLCLMSLIDREPALVMKFERMPGQREERYAHLLCGEPSAEAIKAASLRAPAPSAGAAHAPAPAASSQLEERMEKLEARLQELEERVRLLAGD